jgi:hypothetical protein
MEVGNESTHSNCQILRESLPPKHKVWPLEEQIRTLGTFELQSARLAAPQTLRRLLEGPQTC